MCAIFYLIFMIVLICCGRKWRIHWRTHNSKPNQSTRISFYRSYWCSFDKCDWSRECFFKRHENSIKCCLFWYQHRKLFDFHINFSSMWTVKLKLALLSVARSFASFMSSHEQKVNAYRLAFVSLKCSQNARQFIHHVNSDICVSFAILHRIRKFSLNHGNTKRFAPICEINYNSETISQHLDGR